MTGSALFLDRDGVINADRGYVHRGAVRVRPRNFPIGSVLDQ
jgi:histidinol phosphatase-like enzyme